ncbi:MAG: DNA translocase FtsK [Phycisphaeraceae bacterium]|nr:MAG: DNA translocase FtsK [Phycisphaeraceae bacterium]
MARTQRTTTSKRAGNAGSGRSPAQAPALWKRLGWWALLGVWIFTTSALISHHPADPPGHASTPLNDPVANWCGPVGASIAHHSAALLGPGVWVLLLGVALALGITATGRAITQPVMRGFGLLALALAISSLAALFWPGHGSMPEGAGGLVAIAGVAELTARFSTFGSFLWILLAALVGATLAFDRWLVIVPAMVWRKSLPVAAAGAGLAKQAVENRVAARAERIRLNDVDDDESVPLKRSKQEKARQAVAARAATADDEEDDEEWEYEDEYEDEEDEYEDEEEAEPVASDEEDEEYEHDDELPGAPQVFDPDALRQKIAKLPVRFAGANKRVATEQDMQDFQSHIELEGYQFPGLDLLEDPEDNYSEKIEKHVRAQARALEEALRVYRIDGEVVGIDSGPVITLYEVKLAPGTKVAQLNAISSDLARALKAVNIRIVPNTQGRDTVGIEAPNLEKEKVRLKELMSHSEGGVGKMKLPMFLGKDASGEPLIEDLASMPHMLIAGTTGSGKSVCMNSIIMSFLYTKKPNELKLVLIDPKMVEMSQFRDIPHLMCPVVTEMSKACAILEWAVSKMDERYELLAEAGCRDIATYNALSWEELKDRFMPQNEAEEARIPRKLPYLVFIIDELADLIMTQKEVEGSIVRIAQKARAVGIHLVLATQRPQANVVTGLIKSNMPARISFKVASGMDSRIVLDQKGGELLLGQGDMLVLSPRSHKLMRAQGTLVEDRETRKVVRFLKDVAAPSFERQLMQIRSGGDGEDATERSLENAQSDPLFDKAVEIVLETKRGSVSLLQRRLAIGYTRASRLIDLMGMAGIIGDHKGTVAREVAITPEEWQAMKAQAEADAKESGAAPAQQGSLFEEDEPTTAAAELPKINGAAAILDAAEDEDEDIEEEYDEPEASDEDEYEEEDEDAEAIAEDEGEEEGDEEEDEEWEYIEVEDADGDESEDDEEADVEGADDEEWVYVDEDGNEIDEYEGDEEDDEEEDDEEEPVDESEEPDITTQPLRTDRAPRG